MSRREIWRRGLAFLPEATRYLSALGFHTIAMWPEFPGTPNIDLQVPAELSSIGFYVMKDTQSDGSIRVAIQMRQHRFLGISMVQADGFFISRENLVRGFTKKDIWAVT